MSFFLSFFSPRIGCDRYQIAEIYHNEASLLVRADALPCDWPALPQGKPQASFRGENWLWMLLCFLSFTAKTHWSLDRKPILCYDSLSWKHLQALWPSMPTNEDKSSADEYSVRLLWTQCRDNKSQEWRWEMFGEGTSRILSFLLVYCRLTLIFWAFLWKKSFFSCLRRTPNTLTGGFKQWLRQSCEFF